MSVGQPAVVLDTNVLLSGFVGYARTDSVPGDLLRRWIGGEYVVLVSEPILREVTRGLSSPYFVRQMTYWQRQSSLDRLALRAAIVQIAEQVSGVAPDPDDDQVLATALNGEADYIVTGDKALLSLQAYEGIPIISPRAFLEVLVNPV